MPQTFFVTASIILAFVFALIKIAGNGVVSSNVVFLQTSLSSFESSPPVFTLVGNTIGGPPTTYSWRRNGQEITNNGSYNISLMLDDSQPLHQVHYTSTLNVTGYLPGVYEYSVINRAMTSPLIGNFSVEGMTLEQARLSLDYNKA